MDHFADEQLAFQVPLAKPDLATTGRGPAGSVLRLALCDGRLVLVRDHLRTNSFVVAYFKSNYFSIAALEALAILFGVVESDHAVGGGVARDLFRSPPTAVGHLLDLGRGGVHRPFRGLRHHWSALGSGDPLSNWPENQVCLPHLVVVALVAAELTLIA